MVMFNGAQSLARAASPKDNSKAKRVRERRPGSTVHQIIQALEGRAEEIPRILSPLQGTLKGMLLARASSDRKIPCRERHRNYAHDHLVAVLYPADLVER
jgi:hypothetical protein